MKTKCMIGLLFLLVFSLAVQATPIPVANPSFELAVSTVNTWNWSDQAGTGADVIEDWNYDYTAAAWPSANDTGVFTTGAGPSSDGTPRVSFVRHSSTDAASQVTGPWQDLGHPIVAGMRYTFTMDVQRRQSGTACSLTLNYHDGGTRTEIVENLIDMTGLDNDTWATYSVSFTALPGEPYIGKSLGIEFNNESTADSWQHFDYARVDSEIAYVYGPTPDDGEPAAPQDTDISWNIAPGMASSIVYLRPNDANFIDTANNLLDGVTDTPPATTKSPMLAYDTTYYWRVDIVEPNDPTPVTHTGPVWSFTTIPEVPTVTDPTGVVGLKDTTVTLTVTHERGTSYKWFKDGVTEVDSGTLTADGDITLDVALPSTEGTYVGAYHCEVYNSAATQGSGNEAASSSAGVWTEGLVSHWDFEGDLQDAVTLANGTYQINDGNSLTPVFDTGIDGQALSLMADANHVVIDNPAAYSFHPLGYTASCWVKTAETAGWAGIISKHEDDGVDPRNGWVIYRSGTGTVATLREAGDQYGSVNIADDAWHLLTVTFDPNDGGESVMKQYIDGQLDITWTWAANSGVTENDTAPVRFGIERTTADFAYGGLLDDVRIWNYAVDPYTVAGMYTDFVPTADPICAEDIAMDIANADTGLVLGDTGFEGDCKVNLADFAAMAGKWLDCNLVPNTACN